MMDSGPSVTHLIDSIDVDKTSLTSLIQRIKSPEGSLHVVVSTGSGAGNAKAFYDTHLTRLLSKFGLQIGDYNTHITQTEQSVSQLASNVFAAKALQGQFLLIILLSGDGGVVDILNGLAPIAGRESFKPPYISLLPFGTANALAHSARVSADDEYGLNALLNGIPMSLLSFQVTFSAGARLLIDEARQKMDLPHLASPPTSGPPVPLIYGVVVCSWGFHAAIVADSDTAEFRKHGIDRFKMAANEALYPADGKGPHQYMGDVYYKKGDAWVKVEREGHGYILATAVSNLEKSFTISPASLPLDGSLRLVHFGPLPGDRVMSIMMKAYDGGKHVDFEEVGYEDVDGLRIDFKENGNEESDGERWRRVCIDGKIVAVEKGGWMRAEKNPVPALKVLAPQT